MTRCRRRMPVAPPWTRPFLEPPCTIPALHAVCGSRVFCLPGTCNEQPRTAVMEGPRITLLAASMCGLHMQMVMVLRTVVVLTLLISKYPVGQAQRRCCVCYVVLRSKQACTVRICVRNTLLVGNSPCHPAANPATLPPCRSATLCGCHPAALSTCREGCCSWSSRRSGAVGKMVELARLWPQHCGRRVTVAGLQASWWGLTLSSPPPQAHEAHEAGQGHPPLGHALHASMHALSACLLPVACGRFHSLSCSRLSLHAAAPARRFLPALSPFPRAPRLLHPRQRDSKTTRPRDPRDPRDQPSALAAPSTTKTHRRLDGSFAWASLAPSRHPQHTQLSTPKQ